MKRTEWLLVKEDIRSSAIHFRRAVIAHEREVAQDDRDGPWIRDSAFMHEVQAGHTSLETGLLRIFKILGEQAPHDVDGWRAATVRLAFTDVEGRGTIFPKDMLPAVNETRKARNIASRGYDIFDLDEAVNTVDAARLLSSRLESALDDFIRRIDPSAHQIQESGLVKSQEGGFRTSPRKGPQGSASRP